MISFQNFSFRYEESKDFTLRGIDMTVQTGEFILLTGRSGCGKTTLIRSLNGLIPHFYPGEIQGDLLMDGHSLLEMKPSELAGQVGTVFQDPRSQFFMTDTTRELAFGCENLGLPREETIDRIAKAAKELELVNYLNRSIFALSSGEKQQIAIGSVYALGPKVYIFDEPSANLDYAATKRLAEIMGKLKHAGYTIFVVEHRFYYLRDLIDRAFLIQNGKIEQEFTGEQFCSLPEETRISYGLRTAYPERDAEHYQERPHTKDETHRLNVHNLGFAYKKGPDIFQNVSFEAHAGDVIGILGHNGAGKTTLLSILTGLIKQQRGEVCFDGKKLTPRQRRSLSYLVMQDTDYQLFASSVEEELSLGMRDDCKEKVDETLKALELSDYRERHPASLSGGQKQRVTIGAAIVKGSPVIYFDEPMEVVKVFNKDADSYERFRKDVSDYRDYTLAWYKAAWPWMAIYSSLLPCTIILTLPFGAWFVLSGWSTLPNLILVLCLSLSIGMPLLKSLGFLPTMPQLNYKISALEQVLDAPELQQTEDAFHGKDDTITYDHVSFAYQTTQPGPDGKPVVIEDEVLHDISFTAKAGQKTALVGESGSGKSTLAKLLIHYYDPQKGSISIGGQKLCDMSLEALNSRISYVAQDQYLFNTSLLENIRLGRLNATDEEVVEAAKKAQCMEFLEKLPQGIHSMAGDAGKMLSGGQRQRISLARAILKDAPIVVLDEATAYADPENEEKMEAAIAELVKGKTLVVIAHKLPAIMNADQICVMDHGKLVATGRHQELIQSCPEYQKLWKAAQDSAEWKVHTAKEGK